MNEHKPLLMPFLAGDSFLEHLIEIKMKEKKSNKTNRALQELLKRMRIVVEFGEQRKDKRSRLKTAKAHNYR